MKKIHVLVADGRTVCGLKDQKEGLRPRQAHLATCKQCIKGLRRGFA